MTHHVLPDGIGRRIANQCLIFGFLLFLTSPLFARQSEHATLVGQVVDAETGEPLAGAHVFIASSLLGTASDLEGGYLIEHVPLGAHRIFGSMLGFEPLVCDTLLREPRTYTYTLRLKPTVLEVGEVTVEAKYDKSWKKKLKKFQSLFLGETPNAEQTVILNPEVMDFETKWWGKFKAIASAPLEIENRNLGYRVRYFLKEFISEGGTIKYDGEPFFEELPPADEMEAAWWEKNRREAFYGSLRHYLLAVLADSTRFAGFESYRRPSLEHLREDYRFPLEASKIVVDGPTSTEKLLSFSGYVEVIYDREREEPSFLEWQGWSPSRRPGPQRSWIKLTDGPTLIDHLGSVLDPYGVTVFGYFAFERVADEVPKDYRPR